MQPLGKPCFAHQLKRCRGAIGIREEADLHVIDHWCYLGTARSDEEIEELLEQGRPAFDRDTYMTLVKALKKTQVVHLSSSPTHESIRRRHSDA